MQPQAMLPGDRGLRQRFAESAAFWQVLREKRRLPPDDAFAFDTAYYTLNPAMRAAVSDAAPVVDPATRDANASLPDERTRAK